MPSLQIRDVDPYLYELLRRAAQRAHRSLAQQAVVSLERALLPAAAAPGPTRRQAVLASLAAEDAVWPDDLPDPVDLVREDRSR